MRKDDVAEKETPEKRGLCEKKEVAAFRSTRGPGMQARGGTLSIALLQNPVGTGKNRERMGSHLLRGKNLRERGQRHRHQRKGKTSPWPYGRGRCWPKTPEGEAFPSEHTNKGIESDKRSPRHGTSGPEGQKGRSTNIDGGSKDDEGNPLGERCRATHKRSCWGMIW